MSTSLAETIFWVGVNDYETDLFEALWPLPYGISYNSYLIQDQKAALIDTIKKCYFPEYIRSIRQHLEENGKVDYLIINHMEPDHSGGIEMLTAEFPEIEIVGNEKTADMVAHFYGIKKNIRVVKDQEVLSLGTHQLKFFMTPMLHWPETMMTYEEKTQTLFSGDAFGGFGALKGGIFDDQTDLEWYKGEARRYFSNILGKYCAIAQRTIAKLENLPIRIIASTHGPVFRKNPKTIVDWYKQWSLCQTENGAVIVYASMYENTRRMAERIARALAEGGVEKIKVWNISRTHPSYVLSDLWQYRGLILGSCTYNAKLFPWVEILISMLDNSQIKDHLLGLFGTYAWSSGVLSQLKNFAQKGNWTLIEPALECKGAPTDEILTQCDILGRNFAKALASSVRILEGS
ncbi:MAG: FprA family A-type flavoprotein [Candidatus Omnitrophica bacterium]|nr:FprA family A-type flavoprotein [Candidatus Omnitrophota bacterium]